MIRDTIVKCSSESYYRKFSSSPSRSVEHIPNAKHVIAKFTDITFQHEHRAARRSGWKNYFPPSFHRRFDRMRRQNFPTEHLQTVHHPFSRWNSRHDSRRNLHLRRSSSRRRQLSLLKRRGHCSGICRWRCRRFRSIGGWLGPEADRVLAGIRFREEILLMS